MKIYLAARYSRRDQLRGLAQHLRAAGHIVTSRWLDTEWVNRPDSSSAAPPEYREKYAIIDMEDVVAADAMINFTEPPAGKCAACEGIGTVFWPSEDGGSPPLKCPECKGKGRIDAGRGGRHVEFGLAVALGKRLIVIGHRENLFHHLPAVEFFESPQEMMRSLGCAGDGGD